MKNLIKLPDQPSYKLWAGEFLSPIKELRCGAEYPGKGYISILAHWGTYKYDFSSFKEAHEAAQKLVAEINGDTVDLNTKWEVWHTSRANCWGNCLLGQSFPLEEARKVMATLIKEQKEIDLEEGQEPDWAFKLVENLDHIVRREIVGDNP